MDSGIDRCSVTLAVTFAFAEDPVQATSSRAFQEGDVQVTNALSGASWNLRIDNGATGTELKAALSRASGIPVCEMELFSDSVDVPISDSEVAVTSDHKQFSTTRIRRPRVLVTCKPICREFDAKFAAYNRHNNVLTKFDNGPKLRWIEEPENMKWRALAVELEQELGGLDAVANSHPIILRLDGVRFDMDEGVALKQCSVASMAKGAITKEVYENDRLHFQQLETAAAAKAKDELLTARLTAMNAGSRPCGHDWCQCSDFAGRGRQCTNCNHSIFEHSGQKFVDDSGVAAVGRIDRKSVV